LRIVAANAVLAELAGRQVDDLIGQPFDVLLSGASRILVQTHVYPALQAMGRVEEVFLTLAGPGPEPTPVLLTAVRRLEPGAATASKSRPGGAATGEPGPASAEIVYDVLLVRIRARARWELDLLAATRALEAERTASQRLAADLRQAADDLAARHADESRNREFRDAFVGVISHELRTPITTIYGMSHVLRERYRTMPPEAVEQHLADIEAESDRLRRLTEDLLILSRAETKLEVGVDPIMIGHVVRSAVASETERSPSHAFAVDIGSSLPIVLGEDIYIGQVVRNLASNAVKYSPAGTTIRVVAQPEDGGVAVRVIDEGPGLSVANPDVLFELFYRAPGAIGKTAGAGIGLFVCRELIGAMGGRTWALSNATGPGAEFGFWLPEAADEAGPLD
ncbi:MAG: ATP-binding protein, partial [Candidatus Limnocylindrales bacterium]